MAITSAYSLRSIRPVGSAERCTESAPEARQVPDYLIPLGRTVGVSADGVVSNLSLSPEADSRGCAGSFATAATTWSISMSRWPR